MIWMLYCGLIPRNNSNGGHRSMMIYLTPLLSLIAGILILIFPRLLNVVVAVYLIINGIIGLFGTGL